VGILYSVYTYLAIHIWTRKESPSAANVVLVLVVVVLVLVVVITFLKFHKAFSIPRIVLKLHIHVGLCISDHISHLSTVSDFKLIHN